MSKLTSHPINNLHYKLNRAGLDYFLSRVGHGSFIFGMGEPHAKKFLFGPTRANGINDNLFIRMLILRFFADHFEVFGLGQVNPKSGSG